MQILANSKSKLSNKYARDVISLYNSNAKITDYNTAKKIFDLVRDMEIEGKGARELMMPIINEYAAFETLGDLIIRSTKAGIVQESVVKDYEEIWSMLNE